MLKIKDNVDLKKLEKFGFKYVKQIPETYSYYTLPVTDINFDSKIFEGMSVNVSCNKRYIWIEDQKCHSSFSGLDFLFDLFEAGMVEKVDEIEKSINYNTINEFLIKYKGEELTALNYINIFKRPLIYKVCGCENVSDIKKVLKRNNLVYMGVTNEYEPSGEMDYHYDLAMVLKNKQDKIFWINFSTTSLCHCIWVELCNLGIKPHKALQKADDFCNKFYKENNMKFLWMEEK